MIRLQLALTVIGPPRPWLVVPSESTSPSTSTFTPVRMISPRPQGEMEVIFDPLAVVVPGSIVRLPTTSLSLSALSVMFPPRFVDEGQDPRIWLEVMSAPTGLPVGDAFNRRRRWR